MQKPGTIFVKKPMIAPAKPAPDAKHVPVAHADKHDATTNAKHARKK